MGDCRLVREKMAVVCMRAKVIRIRVWLAVGAVLKAPKTERVEERQKGRDGGGGAREKHRGEVGGAVVA